MSHVTQIILPAFLLDCWLGDPQNPVHPIRIIGRMISYGVRFFRLFRTTSPTIQFLFGMTLTTVLVGGVYFATRYSVAALHAIHPWTAYGFEVILCYFLIAPRALRDESMKVYRSLQTGDLVEARSNLSRIVGRDTQRLDSPGIVCATVETVAENFSDGVVAPLFFVCLGGVPLGVAYKTVSTLDSMIGYRNEKYEFFGKFAARLDDAVNFIPSRIAAMLMLVAAFATGRSFRNAVRIYRRDRRNHKSPNSAQTESVYAGALGLQLGGDNYYNGKILSKPTIGDPLTVPSPVHIVTANRLMYTATVLGILALLSTQLAWRCFHV